VCVGGCGCGMGVGVGIPIDETCISSNKGQT